MKCVTSSVDDFWRRWSKTSAWIASISRNAFVVLLSSCVAFAVDGENVTKFSDAGADDVNNFYSSTAVLC